MTRAWMLAVPAVLASLAVLGGAAGCGTGYVYGRSGDLVAPPKPPGCTFAMLDAPPSQPYDELGVLAPKDIEFSNLAGGPTSFKEAAGDQICAAGGDAVVVERDEEARYIRATVIKLK